MLQKFCIPPLTGATEILQPTTDWCCRNSASHYPLVPPSNKRCSATTIYSFTVWFNGKDIQIVTKVYSNEGKSLDYSNKEVVMAINWFSFIFRNRPFHCKIYIWLGLKLGKQRESAQTDSERLGPLLQYFGLSLRIEFQNSVENMLKIILHLSMSHSD